MADLIIRDGADGLSQGFPDPNEPKDRVILLGNAPIPPAPVFNPASLFAFGETGIWLDPSDLTSMWQDSGKTIPAAVDQPVGWINDKSGRGNNAFQATAAKRPVLRKSGSLYWLEFNGSSMALQTNAFSVSNTADATVLIGSRIIANSGTAVLIETSANYNAFDAMITTYSSGQLASGEHSGSSYAVAFAGVGVGVDFVSSATFSSDLETLRANRGPVGSVVSTGLTNFPAQPLFIGARGATSLYSNMRLYGLMMVGRTLSSGETMQAEDYLASRSGVTF